MTGVRPAVGSDCAAPLRAGRCAWGVLLVSALLLPRPVRAQGQDPWWGPDKALHLGVSAALAGGGYGLTRLVYPEEVWPALVVGGGAALLAGTAKELLDLAGAGNPSWKDLAWDVVGAATGLLIGWLIDTLFFAPQGEQASLLHPLKPAAFRR